MQRQSEWNRPLLQRVRREEIERDREMLGGCLPHLRSPTDWSKYYSIIYIINEYIRFILILRLLEAFL